MAKEFITTDGIRVRREAGDFFVAGRKVDPRTVQSHLKQTGGRLHELSECRENFVDNARVSEEHFMRKEQEQKDQINRLKR